MIEIIFNFSDSTAIPVQLDNKQYHLPESFINGFNTAPILLQLPQRQRFFGIRLQPLAVKKIIGVPASEFLDAAVDLTLLDPQFRSLWHQLGEQTDFTRRVAVFTDFMERNSIDWHPQEILINDFLSGTNQHDLSVPELAGLVCYSPRHLSRKITEATGMNTEEVLNYKKYLHALNLIHHTDLSLTEISYESSFSDQSHFIKAFRQYTQMTPGDYKRNKGFTQGHLYDKVR